MRIGDRCVSLGEVNRHATAGGWQGVHPDVGARPDVFQETGVEPGLSAWRGLPWGLGGCVEVRGGNTKTLGSKGKELTLKKDRGGGWSSVVKCLTSTLEAWVQSPILQK